VEKTPDLKIISKIRLQKSIFKTNVQRDLKTKSLRLKKLKFQFNEKKKEK
jgi:hypothetical protein